MIILKGSKVVTIKASKRAKAHKRKIKTSDKSKESSLKNVVDFYELTIKDQEYESCGVFRDDGSIVFQKDGEKDCVRFDDSEMNSLEGTIFTHNHPRGLSFSPADIRCACDGKMKEMRCISKKDGSVYIMRMKNGSNFSSNLWSDKINLTYEAMNNEVRDKFLDAINNGEMSIEQANDRHWDTVWGLVSEKCPEIEYKKVI